MTESAADHEKTDWVPEGLVLSIEALLMASDEPLSINRLKTLLVSQEEPDGRRIRQGLQALAARYEKAAVDLVEVAEGWRFQVGADHAELVARLWEEKPPRLSRAMLETLALICYQQPVTRSEIEQVRGVSVSTSIIRTLLEFEWVKVVAHREVPGRPALFGTTKRFLSDFGIRQLDDLPTLPEIKDLAELDAAVARLQEQTSNTDTADTHEDDVEQVNDQ